ncbi:hypothetical protein PN462_19240 [Spirulina sp. CS-785/01]|uniref:hypothetical protein n=1 Tax=Spirulina sp. CS-785/01 TaxID=3021716 RepID=UPI00232AD4D4|nr:hypothetical protein [Spirulina sp. CS-785/01]MDB9315258.1 hypothetical protein [Spirulina sp. CS-785/01]
MNMQFKEALRAAGLLNPGRTTWYGVATDGVPVFTIWFHEVRHINGRYFAWWDHEGLKDTDGEPKLRQKGRAWNYLELAAENLGKPCRAVIVHPKMTEQGNTGVASAEYPHSTMSRIVFRTVDIDALQFIAELLPEESITIS